MQLKTIAATGFAVTSLFVVPMQAAEIDAKGAAELRSSLTHYLPEKLANSDFITVQPASRRYEIVVDFSKLIEADAPPDTTVEGLKPMSMFAEPADGGLWTIESGGRLDVKVRAKVADVFNDFRYSIGNYSYAGLFDPAITYFRNGEFKAKDLKLNVTKGGEQVDATFGDMVYVVDTAEGAGGTADIKVNGSLNAFYEKVVTAGAPPVELHADSLVFDAGIKGMLLTELRDLVVFVLDHVKKDELAADEQARLKDLIRKALPLMSSLDETITLNNLRVTTPQGDFSMKSLDYGLQMTGLTNATRFGVSVKAREPSVSSAAVPAAFLSLLPKETEFSFSMPDMNLGGFLNAALDQADLSRGEALSDEQSAELAKMIFPDGKVTVNFDRVAARSDAYDVEMTGQMKTYPDDSKRVSMQATILARDYDKTIAYFQEAAKAEPQFNQFSFGLMMIKGFAKADPDGRQRWDIAVAEDGSVEVNGQKIKGAD